MNNGFIKLMRSEQAEELAKHPNESNLLLIIAYRARRTNIFDNYDLKAGEALLGDYENYGLTERGYRTAKEKLEKWGLATFRTTNKGTIAKLVDNSVYDINVTTERRAERRPSDEPATSQRRLTRSKERKNERNTLLVSKKNHPSLRDVREYIKTKKISNVNANAFYKWYKRNDFKDMNGKPLTTKNFKAKINTWSMKADGQTQYKPQERTRLSEPQESKYGTEREM